MSNRRTTLGEERGRRGRRLGLWKSLVYSGGRSSLECTFRKGGGSGKGEGRRNGAKFECEAVRNAQPSIEVTLFQRPERGERRVDGGEEG